MVDNVNFQRIEEDVKRYPILLYMNGTPMFPRSCTSAMAAQFLDGYKVEYKFFNLMEEISLLECLKEYTGKTVAPQLFISGELVGIGEELRDLFVTGEVFKRLSKFSPTPF